MFLHFGQMDDPRLPDPLWPWLVLLGIILLIVAAGWWNGHIRL